jgi:hypothetical protein
MKKSKLRLKRQHIAMASLMAVYAMGMNAHAQEQLADEPWKVDVYFENDTHTRGKDNTGKTVGLSKFRNTMQVEADKKLDKGWQFHGVLRGTYDGVYRMNKDQYGSEAGSKSAADVQFQNTVAGGYSTVPFGGGLGNGAVNAVEQTLFNNTTGTPPPPYGSNINKFVNSYGANNPGTGLRVLGDSWHNTDGGVSFGVPVRPCNVDSRGCTDFGGYGDKKQTELEMPEFNKRADFIREAYVKNTLKLADGTDLFLKVGRQQIVWGRTDLFRVLDVFNPVDYSRNNIYDELQDIRIPLWSAQAEWRMGGSDTMQERNLQFVWSFDRFRANNLGQCGTPNVILDAGCFFRGMKNLWDNGGTVSNFAHFSTGTTALLNGNNPITGNPLTAPFDPSTGTEHGSFPSGSVQTFPALDSMYMATNFGANQIGIRDVKLPNWASSGTFGMKYEGVSKDGLSFSLNAMTYRSQLPSLRAFNAATNPFTGANPDPTSNLIAFDMYFPRINMLGGSMDFQWQDAGAAVRVEAAVTSGEEFANTARPELYSKNKVFRSVIGFDRPTFIPAINPNRTTLFSAQLFYQHIFNHELSQGSVGPVGMPDWKDNVIGTLLVKAWLNNDRVSPQVITAYDFKSKSGVISPAVEWLQSDNLKWTFGANLKWTDGNNSNWKFDDCRSCNPYAPFTQYNGQGGTPGSAGLGGLEPLGRFRAGPIGAAWKENELFVTMRYKF